MSVLAALQNQNASRERRPSEFSSNHSSDRMGPSSAMKFKSKSNFTRKSTHTKESHANELPSLHVEDDDFPRGGGRDKLKGGGVEEFDVDQRVLKRRKKDNRSHNRKESTEDDVGSLFGDGISGKLPRFANKITLKNVTSGMKLWGVIAEVNEKDIVVSLPGGLRGLVRACDAVDPNMDDVVKEVDKNKYISKMYHEGQLVSCIVLQVDDDRKEITKRKIRLSLRLSLLYKGLTLDAIQEGMVLTAYVKSIEDHGFVLNFGVYSFTGFITKPNLSDKRIIRMGQLLQGAVTSVDRARKVVHMTSDPEVVSKFVTEELNGISMDLLTPGMMVNARVISTLDNGVMLSFLSYFTGTVDIFNLDKKFPSSSWKDNYFKNMKVNARILFIDPSTRAVGLTLNPDLVRNNAPLSLVKIGDIFDQSKIVRVDKGFGVLLELLTSPCPIPAYVNVAYVSDKDAGKWDKNLKEGSLVRVRVLGYSLLEGLATGALKASAIEGSVFTHSDVKPGMVVKAKIITVDSFGAIVQFASGVKALCPLRHMSELEIIKPPKKFQVGVELNFRVLGCKSKRITVTHKKTLVKSKLKILSSYADATDGLISHGWITKIEKHGCFVRFYNGVQGFAPRSELGLAPASDIGSLYHVEQVVKSRVIKFVPVSRQINLSFNMTPTRASLAESMKPGNLVSGVVEHITPEAVVVGIDPSSHIRGTVSVEHLSDHHGLAVLLLSVLKPGYRFDQLLVLDIERNNLVLSTKYSLVNSFQQIPLDIGGIHCQSVIHGYICNVIETGCFVRFLGRLTGFAPKSKATDERRSELSEVFCIGQSVRCNTVDVNTESGRITLSLKQSLCFSTDASFIQEYFLLEEKVAQLSSLDPESDGLRWVEAFGICSVVEGKVHEVNDFGIVISFEKHNDVYGFISRYQLGEAILDINSIVQAAVLDVSKIDRLVDLSLKPEFVNTGRGEGFIVQPHDKKRKGEDNADLDVNQTVNAVVEIVKENYLVLSLTDHKSTVGYASLTDYNTQKLPCKHFTPGQRVSVTIMCLPTSSTGGRLLLLLDSITLGSETSSSKRAKKKSSYDVGHLVQAEITEIKPLEARVKFGYGLHGRIHVTETADDNSAERPFSTYRIGQTLTARIVSKGINSENTRRSYRWELSVKPSMLEGSIGKDECSFTKSSEDFNFIYGQCVSGYVYKIDAEWASLAVSRDITAKLHILDSSCEPPELAEFHKRFYVGKALSGYIICVDKEKRFLRLVLNAPPVCSAELEEKDAHLHSLCHLVEGSIVGGRISKILPGVGGLLVQIGPHHYGKVHFMELADLYESNPLNVYLEGQFVKCKVLEMNLSVKGTVHIDLSLRSTQVASHDLKPTELISGMNIQRVDEIRDLHPDMVVKGYVKSISAKGCFIMLSRKLDAKVLISNLSDDYVENPEKDFPIGKLVTGKVQLVEPLSKRVQVTLKTSSAIMEPSSDINFLDHLIVGNTISGRIKRVESYGLFISIDGTNLVGLCHVSELSDDHIEDLDAKYTVGEKVTVKILKVDKGRNRVSLGMKSSYMKDEDELQTYVPQDVGMSRSVVSTEPTKTTDYNSACIRSINVESGNIHYPIQADSESRNLVPPLEVTLHDIESLDTGSLTGGSVVNVTSRTEESNIKRTKKRVREEREQETRAAEDRLLENGIPKNADEFEKLIRSSPNSSFLWIKYMAYMLSLADIEKARSVAERALETINIREESEKLNIWVAYFNLENEYGNPPEEAVKNVFERSLQYTDPKKVHLALLGMYERTQQHKWADGLLKKMTRKFKHSCKVWLRKVQSLLRQNSDGVRSVVNRALLSLPRHKHIKFISQTAILEFKGGVPDRGRSMFEGILREYPKRTDLWSIYLDQEIRLGDADVIRALFERAISLSLPPKKMKFLFKKYLEYEKSIGDEERIESVKRKAMEYVESTLA